MKATEIFGDYKHFPQVETDAATAQFKAMSVVGEYDFPNTVIYRGTIECGHRISSGYGYESRFMQHQDVTLENILEVANIDGKTPAEVLRDAIRRCDEWFAECEAHLDAARVIAQARIEHAPEPAQ